MIDPLIATQPAPLKTNLQPFIPPCGTGALSLIEQARDYAARGRADNTTRAYASDWRDFEAWCSGARLGWLPASGDTLALYLTARAPTLTVASLERRLAAIRAAHKLADLPAPSGSALDRVWGGIRRTHGRPPRRKRAFVADDLRRAVAALPRSTIGLRDRALLLVGFGAALRRSELAALTLEGPGSGPVRARLVGEGLEIWLDRAKGDQEGEGAVVAIPASPRPETCAVAALSAWLGHAGIEAGPVFRSVDRWGRVGGALSPQAIALIVKSAAERVGLDPDAFAGHSLRAGLATSAAANDAPAERIMEHMRHASFDTTQGYIREGNRFRRNVAAMTGL